MTPPVTSPWTTVQATSQQSCPGHIPPEVGAGPALEEAPGTLLVEEGSSQAPWLETSGHLGEESSLQVAGAETCSVSVDVVCVEPRAQSAV